MCRCRGKELSSGTFSGWMRPLVEEQNKLAAALM
jgi:hypothetical protein